MVNTPREFLFEEDRFGFQRNDTNGKFSEQHTFNYVLIKAVCDTKTHFFIEIDGRDESIFFAKSVLSEQQLLELTEFLQSKVGKRFLTYWNHKD